MNSAQGKVALCACNHRFLSVTKDGHLIAASEKAQEREVMTVSDQFVVVTHCFHSCSMIDVE